MSYRYFDIRISVGGQVNGLYSIYYDSVSPSNYAKIYDPLGSTQNATGLTYTDLTTENGIRIEVPNTLVSIFLYDENNNFCTTLGEDPEVRVVVLATPTPTPTSTMGPPTPTPTPTINCEFIVDVDVISATPTPTPTSSPTPTPTLNCQFDVDVNVNYSPTDISLSNNTINENSATGTTIGTLSTTDLDNTDTHTYTIISGGTNFNISGSSLRSSQIFNYESVTSHDVTIRTTDSIGQFFDKEFTINILNVNEAPYGLTIDNDTQQENTSTGTTIGTFNTLDVDTGDTFTYSLHDTANYPDNSNFILSSEGVLKNAVVFNYESKTSYSIRVRTTDAGGLTYDGTFTINVTNVNESPTNITLSSSSISENVPTGTTIGTLSATDPDAGDTFTFTLVDTITYPDNSSFIIDGTTLKSASVFNYETKSSYSIRVRVTDAGGLSFDKTLTITITDVTITVTASATTNVTCNGGSNGVITVSGASGGTANYTYSKDGTNYQSSVTFSGLTAGSYTIYAKDSYNEVGSTSVTITEPSVVSATTSSTNVTCFAGDDGSITVSNLSGGQGGPYSTKLNVGGTYQVITTSRTYSSLTAGNYTIYVKDTSNCENTYPFTITEPTFVTASVSSTNPTIYTGTGSITISNPQGGQGSSFEDYQVKLNLGSYETFITTTKTYTGLNSGTYEVYIRDSAGCEVFLANITITVPTAPTANISISNISCNGGSDGSYTISNGSGGSGSGYQVAFSEEEYFPYYDLPKTFSGLLADTAYTFRIKDSNGATSDLSPFVLSEPTQQTASITVITQPNCDSSGVVEVSSTGGVFPKTYQVYEDNSFPYNDCTSGTLVATFSGVTAGDATKTVSGLTSDYSYCVKVTDDNGCIITSRQVQLDICQYYDYYTVEVYGCDGCTLLTTGTGRFESGSIVVIDQFYIEVGGPDGNSYKVIESTSGPSYDYDLTVEFGGFNSCSAACTA